MKIFVVVYLSPGGIHYRFRCTAKGKRDARHQALIALGLSMRDIVECYEEE